MLLAETKYKEIIDLHKTTSISVRRNRSIYCVVINIENNDYNLESDFKNFNEAYIYMINVAEFIQRTMNKQSIAW
jgi:hypothetical protein